MRRDPAASGDVVYIKGQVWRYRDGTTATIAEPGLEARTPRTDGVNVLYGAANAFTPTGSTWCSPRLIQPPGGAAPRDLGDAAAGEHVVYRDGAFLLLSGGSVYQLTP